jgi:hypothetical protein
VDSVVKVVCQASGRSFFRIQGSDASPYLLICNFCTCRAFEGHALASNRALLCKHSLAALLADKCKVRRFVRPLLTARPSPQPPPCKPQAPDIACLLQRCAVMSVAAVEWCKQVTDSLLS